ncbi:MAG: L,D-transpeptidase [Muribaculaceae bacterium]|nr:L,D-transpeptidase [Muribaculaceae bacterium]
MKRITAILILIITVAVAATTIDAAKRGKHHKRVRHHRLTYVAPAVPEAKKGLFVVVSKSDLTLKVYKSSNGDTVLIDNFPVCVGRGLGNKQRRGDHRTPESTVNKPFKIVQISDSRTWRHNFHDGRGKILAYGHWYMRLNTPISNQIGIHGSTNNEESVPGRASDGCIRMRDDDLVTFKDKYAYVGMPVIVKSEKQGLFPWERKSSRRPNRS